MFHFRQKTVSIERRLNIETLNAIFCGTNLEPRLNLSRGSNSLSSASAGGVNI